MKLSIIVPVYNVENYLDTCINSIIDNQELEINEFEVLAVNDGSTDSSLHVLEILQKSFSNLKIITQENQGLSGARNTGINNALGKYVLFVDADDYILPKTLNNLINLADINNTDILEFGAEGITPENKIVYTSQGSTNNEVLTGENYLSKINYMGSACNKLYLLSFLNEHDLRFMPNVFIEDIEFNTRAVFFSKRILAIDTIIAHFLQREGSITRSKNFIKKEKMIFDICTVLTSINNFTEKEVTSKSEAYIALKSRVSSLVATMLLRVLKDCKSVKTRKNIIGILKNEGLYPTKFKAETKDKRLFLNFANTYPLFAFSNTLFCYYNAARYGK